MPELPDLEYVAGVLRERAVGRTVRAATVGDPTVLRLMIEAALPELLVGRRLESVARRGHFLRFGLGEDLVLVVNAMLVGRFFLEAGKAKKRASTALVLELDDGQRLSYVDDRRMGKVYVARPADEPRIPAYGGLGLDVLSPAFTREAFERIAARRRDQVRQLLLDKTALASIGNAYADEILFEARLHPKTFCGKLTGEDRGRLFDAIRSVLEAACAEIARRGGPIDEKVRDFLAVRGRDGEPCRRCGTTLRAVRVGAGDACFCPSCQPATRALFIDWRKVGK